MQIISIFFFLFLLPKTAIADQLAYRFSDSVSANEYQYYCQV